MRTRLGLSSALADAGISLFAMSPFDTVVKGGRATLSVYCTPPAMWRSSAIEASAVFESGCHRHLAGTCGCLSWSAVRPAGVRPRQMGRLNVANHGVLRIAYWSASWLIILGAFHTQCFHTRADWRWWRTSRAPDGATVVLLSNGDGGA